MVGKEKGPVWYWLRVGFWVMIVGIIMYFLLNFNPFSSTLIYRIWTALYSLMLIPLFFVVILSVVHLRMYKEKAFARTSLIISSLFLILYIIMSILFAAFRGGF